MGCSKEEKVLYLYYWANSINDKVIKEFEQETGIRVVRDYYDSEEVLESKLLSGTNLYDVVMPSASPYYAREVELGLYLPLDKKKIPNWKLLRGVLLKALDQIDPNNNFGAPYSWGTTGFVYDNNKIKNTTDFTSWKDVLDPERLKKVSSCGVILLDIPQDVFEGVIAYLHLQNEDLDKKISEFENAMSKVRPYIKGFTSNAGKMINDILLGEACVVQMWSGEALRAIKIGKASGRDFRFAVPREHVGTWCDLFAIPKHARHPENAHRFINFMLRSDVAARNIKSTLVASSNFEAKKLLPLDLQKNTVLFPDESIVNKLMLTKALPLKFERKLIRLWSNIKAKR